MTPKTPTLLACFAHPDDEAFTVSGTLADYAARGYNVILVCATRGEAGEISDPALATPATLGQVREQELRQAAEIIGLTELIFLDYRDSGMDGTADNGRPNAFMNAPTTEVVDQLVRIIRRHQPEVALTFEPQGGYGHPDHKAIHNHTVAAFFAAAAATYLPEEEPAWQVQRLFHTSMGSEFFRRMRDLLVARGENVEEFDKRFSGPQWPGDQPAIVRDITARVDTKWAAIMSHRTQINPDNLFLGLPTEQLKQIMNEEVFVQAWPQPDNASDSSDLFHGVNGGN